MLSDEDYGIAKFTGWIQKTLQSESIPTFQVVALVNLWANLVKIVPDVSCPTVQRDSDGQYTIIWSDSYAGYSEIIIKQNSISCFSEDLKNELGAWEDVELIPNEFFESLKRFC